MVDSDGDSMAATRDTGTATLSALKTTVEDHVKQTAAQFKQVDQRFTQVDEQFKRVDQRFTQVEELIRSEGEKTRRHFDVVAEQMKAERNLVLDLGVASAAKVNGISAANASSARSSRIPWRITNVV